MRSRFFVFVLSFWEMRIDLFITNKRLNLETLNSVSAQKLQKALGVLILGILGLMRELRHKKNSKKQQFLDRKFISLLIIQKLWDVKSWNLDATWVRRYVRCAASLEAPGLVIGILQAENGQTFDEFEPIYYGNYRYW